MCWNDISIKANIRAGLSITEAATAMVEMSRKLGYSVDSNFNGIPIHATADDHRAFTDLVEEIVNDYRRAIERMSDKQQKELRKNAAKLLREAATAVSKIETGGREVSAELIAESLSDWARQYDRSIE